jgi:hypothetical protein
MLWLGVLGDTSSGTCCLHAAARLTRQRLDVPGQANSSGMKPVCLLPARRADPGVALTAVARYLPSLLTGGPAALKLAGPFSKVCPRARHLHCRLL